MEAMDQYQYPLKISKLRNNAITLETVPSCMLTSGLLLVICGILTCIWTPFYLMMNERLRMTPGLPSFDWWKDVPETVKIKIYIFTVTNADRFLKGEDAKMKLEEVGPIVLKEKWSHDDVVFNENSTMTYTVNHSAIYMAEWNTIPLNTTLTVPNMLVLGATSFIWDIPFFSKIPVNYIMSSLGSKSIINITIQDYLYNFTDPLIDVASQWLPSVAPIKNFGVLNMIYGTAGFSDRVTAYIGKKYGHARFSLIDKYANSSDIPGRGSACKDKVTNSSESVMYNQFLSKIEPIKYLRKSLCKVVPLYYEREIYRYGVTGYEYIVRNNSYDRTEPSEDDCYKGSPTLPNGVIDMSHCYYNYPLVGSFPHFLYGDPKLKSYVDGLNPNPSLHDSYAHVEPITGIPLETRARIQTNIVMRPIHGFNSELKKFSDTIVPLFWIEYGMTDLPFHVAALMYFTVNIVPIAQWVLTGVMFLSGTALISVALRRSLVIKKYQPKSDPQLNKTMRFEQETLIRN